MMQTATSEAPLLKMPAAELTKPAAARTLSRRNTLVAAGVLAVAVGAGSFYRTTVGRESTDDAQVDAEVVAVPAKTGGTIAHIQFVENQEVKAGDLLATIDDEPARARLAQAEASLASAQAAAEAADADARVAEENAVGNKAAADATLQASAADTSTAKHQISEAEAALASAEATLRQAQLDRDRNRSLYQSGTISKASLDQTETGFAIASSNVDVSRARVTTLKSGVAQAASRVVEASARAKQSSDVASLVAQAQARATSAHAQVATAKAARDLAALDLSYTKIVAPHDGVVSKKTITEGQSVAIGQPVVQLVTPGVWITANFKETQIEHMHAGAPVVLKVDAFPSRRVIGEVESLSGATGSRFTLLPPDNASGNFTKIVQRVPVRIRVVSSDDVVLRPGMNVDVTVDTRS